MLYKKRNGQGLLTFNRGVRLAANSRSEIPFRISSSENRNFHGDGIRFVHRNQGIRRPCRTAGLFSVGNFPTLGNSLRFCRENRPLEILPRLPSPFRFQCGASLSSPSGFWPVMVPIFFFRTPSGTGPIHRVSSIGNAFGRKDGSSLGGFGTSIFACPFPPICIPHVSCQKKKLFATIFNILISNEMRQIVQILRSATCRKILYTLELFLYFVFCPSKTKIVCQRKMSSSG